MTTTARKCKATTKKGQPCACYAMADSDYCFTHNPAAVKQRAAARSKGGQARHGRNLKTATREPIKLQSMADVVNLLETAVNDALQLENSLARGRTIATLAKASISALQFATLEERLLSVEFALKLRDNE